MKKIVPPPARLRITTSAPTATIAPAATALAPPPAKLRITVAAPIVTVSPMVAGLLAHRAKERKIRRTDLARLLAAIGSHYVALGDVPAQLQGAKNAPVPVEILNIVCEELVGGRQWTRLQIEARERADKARRRRQRREMLLQRRAEKVWRRRPDLSRVAVAKIIDPRHWNVTRRVIRKPR